MLLHVFKNINRVFSTRLIILLFTRCDFLLLLLLFFFFFYLGHSVPWFMCAINTESNFQPTLPTYLPYIPNEFIMTRNDFFASFTTPTNL